MSIAYHLAETNLIKTDDAVLCQFLITHLKSGSPPEVILSVARKSQKKEGQPPNSFLLEIATLLSIFEEMDDLQHAVIKAGRITWNDHSDTLPALYEKFWTITPSYRQEQRWHHSEHMS